MIQIRVHGEGSQPDYYHFDTDSDAITWLIANTGGRIREISVGVVAV